MLYNIYLMKIVLVFVTTLDGKVTKWGNPVVRTWSSREDQEYFADLWRSNKLIVMGSNTYNADPVKPLPGQLLIVMTGHPEKYHGRQIPGRIEFTDSTPAVLAERLIKKGYEQMMVVGGPHISTSFLRARLIDEIWLTIEPKLFGRGDNFITDEEFDIGLKLLSLEKVTENGTLITKYEVIRSETSGQGF